jgi:osmotically-inducible protein OsmY
MKSNERLQQDVENAIAWEPLLHAAEIGVTAKDGIITLLGTVDHYAKKKQVEKAAKNVAGVKAIVEKIVVQFPNPTIKTDEEIAGDVIKALENNPTIPNQRLKVKVEDGRVYLEGMLSWDYQRKAAKRLIRHISGVRDVFCKIVIESEIHDILEENLVKNALKRHWSFNADDINVVVNGTTVTLSGVVSSLYQKEEAENIVWKTPGICEVINNLIVG